LVLSETRVLVIASKFGQFCELNVTDVKIVRICTSATLHQPSCDRCGSLGPFSSNPRLISFDNAGGVSLHTI